MSVTLTPQDTLCLHVSSTSTGKAAGAAYSPFQRFQAEKMLKEAL